MFTMANKVFSVSSEGLGVAIKSFSVTRMVLYFVSLVTLKILFASPKVLLTHLKSYLTQ